MISFYDNVYSATLAPVFYNNKPSELSDLKTKAVCFTETMVTTYQTTRGHNPQDHNTFTVVKISIPFIKTAIHTQKKLRKQLHT
jgi:hypothetical protein